MQSRGRIVKAYQWKRTSITSLSSRKNQCKFTVQYSFGDIVPLHISLMRL